MDTVQLILAIGLLVCSILMFCCVIALAILLWRASKSAQARAVGFNNKRSMLLYFIGVLCLWISLLISTLLAFNIIPPGGILAMQIIRVVFGLAAVILMIAIAKQAIKRRNAQLRKGS